MYNCFAKEFLDTQYFSSALKAHHQLLAKLPFKMAALCACDDFLLLSNGRTAAIVNFSSPDTIHQLQLPAAIDGANTNPQPQIASKKSQKVAKQNDRRSQEDTLEGQQEDTAGQVQNKRTVEENRILACAVSTDGQLVALCDDGKCLHVYKLEDGQCRLHFSGPLAHRSTSVTFSTNSQQVIVADKSGDAYVFDVQKEHLDFLSKTAAADTTEDHQTVSGGPNTELEGHHGRDGMGGSLLLGHHSMLLDVLTVDSDRLVVTSDRDEKIRISHYPAGYNIQAYCLGHTQFVISLAYDERWKLLISASGDATLRVWTLSGKELCCKSVLLDIPSETVCGMEVDNAEDVLPADVEGDRQDVPLSLETGKNKQTSRIAIQQICYCSDCQLLFVAIYKSPDILVYKLLSTEHSESVSLQLVSTLGGEGHVASMCVGRCVLWVVRQGTEQLSLAAFRVENLGGDAVKLVPVSDSSPTEVAVLKTLSSQPGLLQAPSHPLDLIPSLWKTPFQGDLKYENNPKRHHENGSKKLSKKQRKLKQ